MKQILALMTLFLILMLTITTVMAIGNVKQSQQMAQRMQLISSLRADLRSAAQEQETLTSQLESERAASRSLRTERNALTKRYDRLMALLHSQPVGYTDMLPTSGGWTSPRIQPLPGESWLQAQALDQLLNGWPVAREEAGAIAKAATAVAEATANAAITASKEIHQTAVTTPPAVYAEAVSATAGQTLQEAIDETIAANESFIFSVKAVSTSKPALAPTPTVTASTRTAAPESMSSPAAIAATRPTVAPSKTQAVATQTPAAITTSPAIAAPTATPTKNPVVATQTTAIATTQTPIDTIPPKPTPTTPPPQGPIATVVISMPPITAATTATPTPQPTPSPIHATLISGLNTLQQWLHQLDSAIDRAISQLQTASQP